ncbi:hypothetical protein [Rhodococcus ruber]|uniref:hypothetical protein n=1 Tax=Rhodococcus ruber TaxID=1830 RepID=UPI003D815757
MSEPNEVVKLEATFSPSVRDAQMMEAHRVAEMVHWLPDLIDDARLPGLAQQACIETFYASVRGLLEFLLVHPTKQSSDYTAATILPGWSPALDAGTQARLDGYHREASRHVLHFTKKRARGWNVVPKSTLLTIADEVLAVWDQYSEAVAHRLAPLRADFQMLAKVAAFPGGATR